MHIINIDSLPDTAQLTIAELETSGKRRLCRHVRNLTGNAPSRGQSHAELPLQQRSQDDRTGTQNITLTAKELKTKRNDLIALLREIGWIYRTYGNITASRYAEQQGYMIQNSGISDRNGAAYSQALITHKGKAKLAEIIAKQKIGGAGK